MTNKISARDLYNEFISIENKNLIIDRLSTKQLGTLTKLIQSARGHVTANTLTPAKLELLHLKIRELKATPQFKEKASHQIFINIFGSVSPHASALRKAKGEILVVEALGFKEKGNILRAVENFEEAARLGNGSAHFYLAEMEINPKNRLNHWKKGAEAGDARCCLELGHIYEDHNKLDQARKMYKAAGAEHEVLRVKVNQTAHQGLHVQNEAIEIEELLNECVKNPEIKLLFDCIIGGADPLEGISKSTLFKIAAGLFKGKEPLSKKDLLNALFTHLEKEKSPALLAEARESLQNVFLKLSDRLEKEKIGPEQEKLYEIFLGDLLTLYPFFEAHLETAPVLTIPQKLDGQWQKVTYQVEPLKLTQGASPVYAYGLTPKDKAQGAHPLLIFMGTPPGTTSGHKTAVWTDLIPGHTVGETLYKQSQKLIEGWVKKTYFNGQQTVRTYGKSLGGSMCLLTSIHCGDKVEANAYNPPGLSGRMYKLFKHNMNKWNSIPIVKIYRNENDPVSTVGKWPKFAQIYQIMRVNKASFYLAHVQSFLAKKVAIIKLDASDMNRQGIRKIRTVALHVASTILVPFTSLGLAIENIRTKTKF